jgi:hypothetical protein
VPRSIEYNWSTEFILLSVRALDEFVYSARATIRGNSQIGVFLGSLERVESDVSNRTSSRANEQVEGAQTPCQGRKCAKMGTTQSGKHMGIRVGSKRWGRKASDGM